MTQQTATIDEPEILTFPGTSDAGKTVPAPRKGSKSSPKRKRGGKAKAVKSGTDKTTDTTTSSCPHSEKTAQEVPDDEYNEGPETGTPERTEVVLRKPRQFFRGLECVLTREEQRLKGLELADLRYQLLVKEKEKAQVTAQFKEDIDDLVERTKFVASVLRSGHEIRQIECEERFNYSRAQVLIIRQDDFTTVEERAMTTEELQTPLDLS